MCGWSAASEEIARWERRSVLVGCSKGRTQFEIYCFGVGRATWAGRSRGVGPKAGLPELERAVRHHGRPSILIVANWDM
jgi:hypothetical protein